MKVASMVTMSPTNILRRSEMQMISTETKLHLYKYAVLPNSTNNLTNLINTPKTDKTILGVIKTKYDKNIP